MESVDIVIIGAGLSGIGAAVHLTKRCPDKSFLILEGRENMGGTWDLFRYPGIRSDSDMYTLGYNFKPWTNPKSIADGPAIREYIQETAQEYGLTDRIRFGHKVQRAEWSSSDATWTLQVDDLSTGDSKTFVCNFVFGCTGYYNYAQGHAPEFAGSGDFSGDIIHPQFWPEDYDYSGKNVVVVGSGATAYTVVPAMTDKAAHVTMLQRSPTYVLTLPLRDRMANAMRKVLPEKLVYRLTRTRNIALTYVMYYTSKWFPEFSRRHLLKWTQKQLGPNVDMKHFEPNYNPWDERLCAVPDGDFFTALNSGKSSVVTDHVDRFTESGIQLTSGEHLDADLIVTATGLELQFMGGIQINVDGERFDDMTKMNYKGVMLEDLPNIGFVFGYTNASWTLKSDLSSEFVCRAINTMDKAGCRVCVPVNSNPEVQSEPFIADLKSGYIKRGIDRFPNQGTQRPWRLYQNYVLDLLSLRFGRVHDGVLTFGNPDPVTEARDDAELIHAK